MQKSTNSTNKRNHLKGWLLSNKSIKFFDFVLSIFSPKIKRNVKQIIIKLGPCSRRLWLSNTIPLFLFEIFALRLRIKWKSIIRYNFNKFKDCLLYTRSTRDIIQIEENECISFWLVRCVILYAFALKWMREKHCKITGTTLRSWSATRIIKKQTNFVKHIRNTKHVCSSLKH